jgi:PST family polysaccharide transporter
VARLGNVLLGIVLARLLVPADYGVFAIGLVAVLALQSMNELGTSIAIIRWRGDVRRPARTATTISLVTSVVMYVGCFFAAPALAAFLNEPSATDVLRFMTLGVLCSGLSTIPNALLSRELQQGRRLIADTVGFVVSTALTVPMAILGFGTAALAAGTLVGNLAATIAVLLLAPFRPLPGWDKDDARALLRFGMPMAWASLFWFAIMNVDYLVVGRVLDATQLGLYLLAFNLSSWPYNLLAPAIRRVAITGFARLNDDPRAFNDAFTNSMGNLIAIVLLPSMLLALLSEPLIEFLYGSKWAPAAGALSWLAIVGFVRVLCDLCYDALVGRDRPKSLLRLQILWFVTLVPILILGTIAGGIVGTGIGHAVVVIAIVTPAYLLILRADGILLRPILSATIRPAVAAGLLTIIILVGRQWIALPLVQILVLSFVSIAAYAVVVVPRAQLQRWGRAVVSRSSRSPVATKL